MKQLSASAAANCENATTPICRCRCGGAFHGSARGKISALPVSDPHSPSSECPRCKGRGKIDSYNYELNQMEERECPSCEGQKRIIRREVRRQLERLEVTQ